jgi:glycosyltransferase involved in cell wall biosynthesis
LGYKQLCKRCCSIQVIPNPNSLDSPQVNDIKFREKTVLAVGRLSYQKGFDLLIEAWNKVGAHEEGWKLQIVGSGEEDEKLYRLVKNLNLDSSLEFIPATKNIEQYYPKASFFVLSSRYEGYPLVLVEAMGFSLPCIAFDCKTGPREIIGNHKDGLLVETGNVTELAEQIWGVS